MTPFVLPTLDQSDDPAAALGTGGWNFPLPADRTRLSPLLDAMLADDRGGRTGEDGDGGR